MTQLLTLSPLLQVVASLSKRETPCFQGVLMERMKGLEPSTFCMASRRSSQLSYIRARAAV